MNKDDDDDDDDDMIIIIMICRPGFPERSPEPFCMLEFVTR